MRKNQLKKPNDINMADDIREIYDLTCEGGAKFFVSRGEIIYEPTQIIRICYLRDASTS